jgi:hypothetical protein
MELNKKALDILLKYNLLEPNKTSKEDYLYAKDAGYMFECAKQTHDEAMVYAFQELAKCKKKHMTNLFLSSLSTARMDWRAGLSAYTVVRILPKHQLVSNGINCRVCPTFNNRIVDYSAINKTRYEIGGLDNYGGNLYDWVFMLRQHNMLPDKEPIKKDYEIFKAIIEIVKNADSNDGPSKIQKKLIDIEGFKSNKWQRGSLLETLGFCSILETAEHKGLLHQYVNLGLAPSFRHSSFWAYPIDWWKGKDGINQEALSFWFGDYEELGCLFI